MIFNQIKYAESLISNPPNKIQMGDLYVLKNYYRHLGLQKNQTMNKIKEYCLKCDPNFNFVLYRKMLDSIAKNFKKGKLRVPKDIYVTKKEIVEIKSLNDYKQEKVLFILLVLSKIYNNDDNNFYANMKFSKVIKMAKVTLSKAEKIKIIHDLEMSGLVSSNMVSGYFKINFVDLSSEPLIEITDLDNIIDYYPFYCKKCGKQLEKINYKKELCDNCYKEKRREDIKNNVKSYREKTM